MKDIRKSILWWALKRRIALDKPIIIAITGSFAKTSTKEAVKCALKAAFHNEVISTWGNLNTPLGVPLGILGYKIDFYKQKITWQWVPILIGVAISAFTKRLGKFLIVELGVDRMGDMNFFVEKLSFDVAVITRLGEAHLVNFPSVNDYWKEKLLIAEGLKRDGLFLINNADTQVKLPKNLLSKMKIEKFSCPDKDIAFTVARHIAKYFSIEQRAVEEALSHCQLPSGRMTIHQSKSITLMDDSYNANPQSMVSALKWLNEGDTPKRRVAIIGDMLELGDKGIDYHRLVGVTARKNADTVIAVGPLAKNYLFDYHFSSSEEAAKKIIALLRRGDKILVKGSHGIHMEKIVEAIRNEFL